MVIKDIEPLEAGLESGLEGSGLGSLPSGLRLRMGVCGIASIAVQELLRQKGVSSQVMMSRPKLSFDEALEHVFVMVDDVIIDPTYSQFVHYAGVIPFDVARGDADDVYPERKIEQFNVNAPQRVVQNLARAAKKALAFRPIYDHYDLRNFTSPTLEGFTIDEMSTAFMQIWTPDNFTPYEPTSKTRDEGLRLSRVVNAIH